MQDSFSVKDSIATETVATVPLKFCVDTDWKESMINLGFIDNVMDYDIATDEQLRKYPSKKAEESKDVLETNVFDRLVDEKPQIDMTDTDIRSLIKTLFISYHLLLHRHGLSWFTKERKKVAVFLFFSAFCPKSSVKD